VKCGLLLSRQNTNYLYLKKESQGTHFDPRKFNSVRHFLGL